MSNAGKLTIALLLAAALGSLGLAAYYRSRAAAPPLLPAQAGNAGAQQPGAGDPTAAEAGFIGVILAGDTVDIEPRVEGRIEEVFAEVGDQVQRGARLARLDAAALQDDLIAARAVEQEARLRLRRRERLGQGGAFTAEEMDGHRRELVQARARTARLARAVADAAVMAPFDGSITERYLGPGALAGPGKPIFRLVGRGEPRVRFAVPEERAGALAIGVPVALVVPSSGQKLRGRVTGFDPDVDASSRMVHAAASIAREQAGFDRATMRGLIVRVFVEQPMGLAGERRP